MKLFESSPSLTMHNVTIVTRLRSQFIPSKKPSQNYMGERTSSKFNNKSNLPKLNSNSKNKYPRNNGDSKLKKNQTEANISRNNAVQRGLNENISYTMFTSNQPCNLMLVSSKPIEGATINQAFQDRNNLYDFGKNFLKESALFEFDKIYNETHSVDLIYRDLIKENISNLFQKKNSCVILYGPVDGGKSFLLRGGSTNKGSETGLLSRAIRDTFRLISLYNQASNNSSSFHVKFCSYQIYLDNIHDLLSTESPVITVEKYIENNYINTNLVGLTEREIKNFAEYENCMREAVHNRATLSQKLKINDLNRKSHFIISIRLEKRTFNKDGILILNDNLKNFSRIDFVELTSSNFGQIEQISENDFTPKGMLYKNTDNAFNSLCENIVCSCNCTNPENDCPLTLALKNSINPESNIVFINCVIPWEYPPIFSLNAVKFTNWLRNLVIEQNQTIDKLQNAPNILNKSENNVSQSVQRLPSAQRNDAYGNNYEPKKNITIASNKKNYLEKENEKDNYNTNPYKNKIDRNNGQFNNDIKSDYEEQVGNLTMVHNHPQLINENRYFHNKNSSEMNYSMNLPNTENYNTMNQNRQKYPRNNDPLYINDSTEEEIRSLRDRIRKKYQSSSIEKNRSGKNSQNNTMVGNPEENCEGGVQTYERAGYNTNVNMNKNSSVKMNNSYINRNNININNSNEELNNVSRMTSPQELKIKELENKVRLLEEKSFANTQKLEEIRINKEAMGNNNITNGNNNLNYSNNNVTVSYLPDAEVEKIKQEKATLKSDNIIFREDINRLTDINHHLENELIEQRNRNIELANDNEQLVQEKAKIEKEVKELREIIEKNKLKDTSLEQYYNERLMLQNRMRDNENELRKAIEEKSKYEIDFKVLQSRFTELQNKYDKINDEYANSKQVHEEELSKIENKIEQLTTEMEKLRAENSTLRMDNERQRTEISSMGGKRDDYRDKYEEQKKKNEILCGKIEEIETEFRNLQKEKNNEMMYRCKMDETKRNKSESKAKIINELQERIQNYRRQRMMNKKEDEEEFPY